MFYSFVLFLAFGSLSTQTEREENQIRQGDEKNLDYWCGKLGECVLNSKWQRSFGNPTFCIKHILYIIIKHKPHVNYAITPSSSVSST
ncbi:hypothetical protein VNO77_42618 [Canavalia gladiata]|uniref:Secreted protein n=1 Tax=Canavalia gladiata TaxID=3824 RepID=A0AAN9PNL6_CANGL